MTLFRLQQGTVWRGQQQVLDRVDIELEAGKSLALMGTNGSGKTSLLLALMGLVPLSAGAFYWEGARCVPGARHMRLKTGAVFQEPSVDAKLTVGENLLLGARLMGCYGRAARTAIDALLPALGLTSSWQRLCGQLSGGMRRRVELARALIARPRLLVLDEPTFGLDPAARSHLWSLLEQRVAKEGLAILTSTHDPEEAAKHDRVALLGQRRVLACDSPAALLREHTHDVVVLTAAAPETLLAPLAERLNIAGELRGDEVWVLAPEAHVLIPKLVGVLGADRLKSVALRRTHLGDVLAARSA